MDQTDVPLEPCHLGVPSGASKTIPKAMVHLAQPATILHRHKHRLQMDRNEIPHDPRHQGVPSGASKTIFKPMVRSAHTVHLSCVKISTISKRTETSFQLSPITLVYHRERPKRFLTIWYVSCKPCTYLVIMLTLSPCGPKQDST
jgi:hypothetical protein